MKAFSEIIGAKSGKISFPPNVISVNVILMQDRSYLAIIFSKLNRYRYEYFQLFNKFFFNDTKLIFRRILCFE